MQRTLKTFVIPAGKPAGTPPKPGTDVELEAPTEHALLAAAHESLAKVGQRARAVSFTRPASSPTRRPRGDDARGRPRRRPTPPDDPEGDRRPGARPPP
ncbi:MAG TPA: hypothetical protein VKE49_06070 [Myxococcaceae bacterium]|nr:hypothetical protein [Myxococcaceae bacterium]